MTLQCSSLWTLSSLWLLLLLRDAPLILAGTPDVTVNVPGVGTTWFTQRGLFGSKEDKLEGLLVHSPSFDDVLCEYYNPSNKNIAPLPDHEPWVMMVPRGICSFEQKLYAAKMWYKAKGILVYDTLSARYQYNNKTKTMWWPQAQTDYDCGHGYGFVSNIQLDPPAYDGNTLDPLMDLTLPTHNCTLEKTQTPCESQLFLVTGQSKDNSSTYPVCCAWDLPITMLPNPQGALNVSDVMAVFLTIRQGDAIMNYVGQQVVIKARPHKAFNPSQIFLWLMGVIIAFVASWFASSDLRIFRAKLAHYQEVKDARNLQQAAKAPKDDEEAPRESNALDDAKLDDLVVDPADLDSDNKDDDTPEEEPWGDNEEEAVDFEDEEEDTDTKKKWVLSSLPLQGKEKEDKGKFWVLYSSPPEQGKLAAKRKRRPGYKAEQTAETDMLPTDTGVADPEPWASPIGDSDMSHWHVLSFLVSASALLFLLFYFRFYQIVFIFYGFGCAGAVSHLLFGPSLTRVIPKFGDEVVKELNKPVLCGLNGFDVTSQLMGLIWAIVWVWYVSRIRWQCSQNLLGF